MTAPSRKLPGGWRVVLAISLALNLLTAGVFVGSHMKWSGKDVRHHGRFEQAGGPLLRALAEDDRRAIGREIRQMLRDDDPGRGRSRLIYEAMIVELRADEFDPDSMAELFAQQRARLGDRMAMAQDLLLRRVAEMNATERAMLAERLQEGLQRKNRQR